MQLPDGPLLEVLRNAIPNLQKDIDSETLEKYKKFFTITLPGYKRINKRFYKLLEDSFIKNHIAFTGKGSPLSLYVFTQDETNRNPELPLAHILMKYGLHNNCNAPVKTVSFTTIRLFNYLRRSAYQQMSTWSAPCLSHALHQLIFDAKHARQYLCLIKMLLKNNSFFNQKIIMNETKSSTVASLFLELLESILDPTVFFRLNSTNFATKDDLITKKNKRAILEILTIMRESNQLTPPECAKAHQLSELLKQK
jgi:hypothetical protein